MITIEVYSICMYLNHNKIQNFYDKIIEKKKKSSKLPSKRVLLHFCN